MTARIAAAANISASANLAVRARYSAATNVTEAATTAIQAKPANPTRRPPTYARYAAVMSGSWAPTCGCPTLGLYRNVDEIIPPVAQSKRTIRPTPPAVEQRAVPPPGRGKLSPSFR